MVSPLLRRNCQRSAMAARRASSPSGAKCWARLASRKVSGSAI